MLNFVNNSSLPRNFFSEGSELNWHAKFMQRNVNVKLTLHFDMYFSGYNRLLKH